MTEKLLQGEQTVLQGIACAQAVCLKSFETSSACAVQECVEGFTWERPLIDECSRKDQSLLSNDSRVNPDGDRAHVGGASVMVRCYLCYWGRCSCLS